MSWAASTNNLEYWGCGIRRPLTVRQDGEYQRASYTCCNASGYPIIEMWDARNWEEVHRMSNWTAEWSRKSRLAAILAVVCAFVLAVALARSSIAGAPPPSVDSLMPPGSFVSASAASGALPSAPPMTEAQAGAAALKYIQPQLNWFADSTMHPQIGVARYGLYTPLSPKFDGITSPVPAWIVTLHDVPSGFSTDPSSPYNAVGMLIDANNGQVLYSWDVVPTPNLQNMPKGTPVP